ncbi:MAG: hypothetical protein NTV63_05805, partial [Candidatus Woesearchaeota archaeon]|nr:hypothetical protein [Candidatus Woesearchaeota archaeon]
NLSSIPIYGWIVFLTAIPFSIAHIASNLIFASGIPNAGNFVSKKFGFERIPACRKLAETLKSRLENNNIKEEQ